MFTHLSMRADFVGGQPEILSFTGLDYYMWAWPKITIFLINSLYRGDFNIILDVIFKPIVVIYGWNISWRIVLR